MKNVLILLLLSFFCGGLSAQNISQPDANSITERQIALDTREMEQFEEQFESFSKALDAGNKEDIAAVKLMIQETMMRTIEKPREVTSAAGNEKQAEQKTVNKPSRQYTDRPVRLNAEEQSSREARGVKYLEQKKKKGQLTKTEEIQQHTKEKNNASEDKWTVMRQKIYTQFLAVEYANDPKSRARIDKLLSSFYDTMEQDLMEKKKQLAAKK